MYDDFIAQLQRFYDEHGRHDMAWRQPEPDGSFDPYKILVSEVMLQQTQVSRVAPKYAAFLQAFPTVDVLAAAPLSAVLQLWSGLGYNRRAKFLWQAARAVAAAGTFPDDMAGLQALSGVGANTAGAIMAYAYDQPVVYLETNIRTVLIQHYFADANGISDTQLRETLAEIVKSLGDFQPRQFYWAMMDYGAFLKQSVGNLNRSSRSYSKQSKFEGSLRQLRGKIIRLLADEPLTLPELEQALADERTTLAVDGLLQEAMIARQGSQLRLP